MGDRWYVAETQFKQELVAVENIERQGFRTMMPTFLRRHTLHNRVADIEVPLFPNYVMVSFDIEDERWPSINGSRGVKRLLPISSIKPSPLPDDIAGDIVKQCGGGPLVLAEYEPSLFKRDERLRVIEGTFTGLIGICKKSNRERVRILLHMFGRAMVVSLPAAQVARS